MMKKISEQDDKYDEKEEAADHDVPLTAVNPNPSNIYYVVQSPAASVTSSQLMLCRREASSITNLIVHDDDDEEEEEEEEEEEDVYKYTSKNRVRNTSSSTSTSISICMGMGMGSSNMSRCSSSRASVTFLNQAVDDDNESRIKNIHLKPLLPHHHHHHHKHATSINATAANANANNNNPADKKAVGKNHYYYQQDQDEDEDEYEDDDANDVAGGSGGEWCFKYLSFNTYSSSYIWISIQLMWRLLFSLLLALLVFYLVTKPPPPYISIQMGGVKQFELSEGVDRSGVGTNLLTCNISMLIMIDNKSKIYNLFIQPQQVAIYFKHIPLVVSRPQQQEEEVKREEKRDIRVNTGVIGKVMYGAGREMQDALKSVPVYSSSSSDQTGSSSSFLELMIKVWIKSYYKLIGTNFHHKALCVVSLHYNHHHTIQAFNTTTCRFLLT